MIRIAFACAVSLTAGSLLAEGFSVRAFETSASRPFREIRHLTPPSPHGSATVPVLDLDAAKASHKFKGLGVSFSEASCRVLRELPAAERERALRMVFTDAGAGLTMGRVQVGCSDYSTHIYTYDDVMDDFGLKHFSIDEDRPYVLPVIREALKYNPDLFLFASVWTPPAWMKKNRALCGGTFDRTKLPYFCDYYVKFLQAYAKEGIRIRAISAQNEPCSDQQGESPECIWVSEDERQFASVAMPPKLKAAGLDAEIWLHDCETHEWTQVQGLLDDPAVKSNVQAVAWHSYGPLHEQGVKAIRAKHPEIAMYHTEMGPHLDGSRTLLWWAKRVTSYFQTGFGSFTSWCLALDEDGRPNVSRGFNCAGFLEIHSETGAIRPSAQWDLFRHIGPYVRPGADILDTTSFDAGPDRKALAFRNPDGSVVVVAYNAVTGLKRKFQLQVKYRGEYVWFQIPDETVMTAVLN